MNLNQSLSKASSTFYPTKGRKESSMNSGIKKTGFYCMMILFIMLFCNINLSFGQISQRGTATFSTTGTTSVTVNKPSGVVAGDIMIANVSNFLNATNVAASCSGWTTISTATLDRGFVTLTYKIAGSSEPSSYTFTVTTGSSSVAAAIVAFSGVDNNNPFDVTPSSSLYTSASTTLTGIPSISTVTNGSAIIVFGACNRVATTSTNANFTDAGWTVTSPSALTELYDVGSGVASTSVVGAAWGINNIAGETGTGSLTCNLNTGNIRITAGQTIALRPCVSASAGSALSAICQGSSTVALGGSVGGDATGGTWSDGGAGGSFSPNANTLNAVYTSSATYAGTATLTLTATGSVCGAASASKTVVVKVKPGAVTATSSVNAFCGPGTVNLTGTTAGTSSSTIAFQGFESTGSTVSYTAVGGATKTGASGSTNRPASSNYFVSGTTGYWVNNGTAVITADNITGLSGYSAKKLSFRLAAFDQSIASSNGVDNTSDSVKVAISLNGGLTYSNEIYVTGSTANNAYWSYAGGTGVASVNYSGLNTPQSFYPTTAGEQTTSGYSTLNVNLPDTCSQVKIMITMINNNGEGWAIDDITLSGTQLAYAWSSSPAGFSSGFQNVQSVSVSSSTIYTLTATNNQGCTSSDTAVVNINNFPSAPTAIGGSVCVSGTVNISASVASGETIDWYAMATGGSVLSGGSGVTTFTTPSISANTTYYAEARNSSTGCISSSRTAVVATVNPLPTTVTVSGAGTFCQSATLTASNSSSGTIYFQGTNSGGTSVATPSTSQNVTSSGTYYFRAQSAAGCWSGEGSTTVTIVAPPVVSGANICAGGSGTLSTSYNCTSINASPGPNDAGTGSNVTGAGTLAWTNPGNIAAAGNAGMSVALSTTTNYLQGSNYGFAIPSNATINGITVAISRATNNSNATGNLRDNIISLVKGGTIQSSNKASASVWTNTTLSEFTYGGSSDLWGSSWTPSDINASNFGVVLSVTNISTASARTVSVDYMKITVSYTIPGSLNWYTVSSGGTSIGSGSSFNPVGVANSGLMNTNTAGSTTYYVECTSASISGCRGAGNFVINETPSASINNNTGSTELTCARTSINVTATGGSSYLWSNGLGANATQSLTTNGTYSVVATGANGCTSSASVVVTSNTTAPVAAITNNTGSTELTCARTSINVTATGGSSYLWSNGLGANATQSLTTNGTYSVVATGANGCTSSASVVVTSNTTAPVAAITNNTGSTELTCARTSIDVTGTGGSSYVWSGGLGTSASASITAPGTYSVIAMSANGCTSSASISVSQNITSTSSSTSRTACDSFTWNGQTYTSSGTYTYTTTNTLGCDSTATLSLTLTPSTNHINTVSACDSYKWSENGVTYTSSGTYNVITGCHTETLNLTITSSSSLTTTVSACDSYEWSVNGQTYTSSGIYTDVDNCHTEILNLTITSSTNNTTAASVCDSYVWSVNGQTYTSTGTYTQISGCHTETLNLTVTESTTHTNAVTAGNSYTWSENNQTYTESGTYNVVTGCHTEVLNLTIVPLTRDTTFVNACDSYTWSLNSQTYTASGIYSNVSGFHTQYLNLTVTSSSSHDTTISACDSYTWSVNGQIYFSSGTYTDIDNCHTETLNLTVTSSSSHDTTISVCDSYTWPVNGQNYTSSGTYNVVSGCHTEVLNLTITASTTHTNNVTACDSYTWTENGVTYTASGTYYSVTACHTEVLNLTITTSTSDTTTASACDSYVWSVNGQTYTESGTYTDLDNCHTKVLNLAITSSTSNTTTHAACDSYTWPVNGVTYTQGGTYTSTTGCHSEILNLTITSSSGNTTTVAVCDSYVWSVNGETYTSSGTYTSVDGCHTETLELTITSSTNNTTTASACESYTWAESGLTYSESGTYSVVSGCHTEILNLTINPSTSNTTIASACDSYVWSVNGETYTTSGTYTSVDGCHSEILELTINSSTSNTITQTACGSYTWAENNVTYTESGTYTSVEGCSTHLLNLTINALPEVASITGATAVCEGSTVLLSNVTTGGIWSSSDNSVALINSSGLVSGLSRGSANIYYTVTNQSTGCSNADSVLFTVNLMPAVPDTIYGPTEICRLFLDNGKTDTITYSVTPISGAASYSWILPAGATLVGGEGTSSIDVIFDSIVAIPRVYIYAAAVSATGCTSKYDSIKVWKTGPVIAITSGPRDACPYVGTEEYAVYTATINPLVRYYDWVVPAGATIMSGQGTSTIYVKFDSMFRVSLIKVRGMVNCGVTSWVSYSVTRNTVSSIFSITGPANACNYSSSGSTATYSINTTVQYATSFIWTLPAGVTLISGGGTSSITVRFESNFVTSIIRVKAVNNCGASPERLMLVSAYSVPDPPVNFYGSREACTYFSTPNALLSDTVIYRVNAVPYATSYKWTLPPGVDSVSPITNADTFIVVRFRNTFTGGVISVRSVNPCVSSAGVRSVTIFKSVATTPAAIQKSFVPSVAAITNVSGLTTDTLRIRKVATATSYNWALRVGAYATITHLNALGVNDTAIVVNVLRGFTRDTVSVATANSCSVSSSATIALTALVLPSNVGTLTGYASFCLRDTITYTATPTPPTSLQSPIVKYRWTLPLNSVIVSSNTDSSVVRIKYGAAFVSGTLSVKGVSALGLLSSTAMTLAVAKLDPAAPSAITGPASSCAYYGNGVLATYTVSPVANATSYQWTMPANVTVVSGLGTASVTVRFDSGFVTSYISVQAVNNCSVSAIKTLQVTATPYGTPISITGPANACYYVNNDAIATYTTRKVTGAPAYLWSVPAGATIVSHPGGTGINDTIINVTYNSSFVYGSSISVSTTGCTNSAPRTLAVTGSVPAQPGVVSGPANVCEYMQSTSQPAGAEAIYKIAKVSGATSYTWTVPANATLVDHPAGIGVNDTIIKVVFNISFTSGSVTVKAGNYCGYSVSRTLSVVRTIPSNPGVITAVQTGACPNVVYTYSIPVIPANATSVQWSVPSVGTITSGIGTRTITVSYPPTVVNGIVTAQAFNNCGRSLAVSSTVRLDACPASRVDVAESNQSIQLKVFPNPSSTQFNLNVSSSSSAKISVRILDMQGRQLKAFEVMANQNVMLGSELKTGAYMLEVKQGNETKTTRVVKY